MAQKMYTYEKTYTEEKYNKSRKNHKDTPSFSSTLLDEIYRSIDGGEDFTAYKEKLVKKHSGYRTTKTNIIEEDEEKASIRRACLVEEWIKKEKYDKVVSKRNPSSVLENKSLHDNNDLLFFSSTSSSNSDSSGALSSSDTEFFASQTKPKVSCFSTRPKPIRTGASAQNHEKSKNEDDLIKYKSRALKMYANLKNVKQPISPGGRLTSFINSLFSNSNGKKPKNIDTSKKIQDFKSPKAQSACSFSRSCLSKYSPRSREKTRNGDQRTVRFHPVSVIVDEDSRPCGHKCIYDERSDNKYGKPPLPRNALSKMEKNRKVGENAQNDLKGYNNVRRIDIGFSMFRKINGGDDDDEEDDDYDGISDSSSDLFELDHLAFGNNRFREELPVYETTRLDTNRVIASRLVR